MMKTAESLYKKGAKSVLSTVRRFHDDEDGSMIVFTLFVLVLMLVVAGMAVDFMRFESRRSIMQGAVDRAVLAAADLDQNLDSADVVRDYISKSQGGDCLNGDPIVTNGANFRSVTANCELVMDTFFLRLIGMDSLTAAASATAIEGVGHVEVSLVVDISGSMGGTISGTSTRKIDKLEEASLAFVDTLLQPDYADKISLSLIPYSAHVNAGPELFDAVNAERVHGFSSCVEIPDSEFSNAGWDDTIEYQQGQHFDRYGSSFGYATCPQFEYEEIIPVSQDKAAFDAAIQQLEPRGTTSIFMGLKWATALLDPSFQDEIASLPASMSDPAFAGRPSAHGDTSGQGGTKKYIVVMTDGENFTTTMLQDWAYDSPSEIAHWAERTWQDFDSDEVYGRYYNRDDDYMYEKWSSSDGDELMDNICTAAKSEGITIFAIAMGSTSHGEQEMSKCASSPSHYYETSGDELVQIFEAIADQITDLRLTL